MDFDDRTRDASRGSIAERAGYRGGEAGDSALSATEALLSSARARRKAAEPVAPTELPVTDAVDIALSVAVATAAAHATHQDNHDSGTANAVAQVGYVDIDGVHSSGSSSDTPASTAGTEVSATTDMGAQAHVGGSGVVSAASTANLDADDAEDDEVVAQARRVAETDEAEQNEAVVHEPVEETPVLEEVLSEPSEEMVQQEPVAAPSDQLVPQRILVSRGEANTSAVYSRTALTFDGRGSKQAKEFPITLERALRADLASMTNDEFASALPISNLLTAFVATQLGVVSESGVDDNTVTAMQAFRMTDHRTGVLEEGLAELSAEATKGIERLGATVLQMTRQAEKMRLLENALTFLVTERLQPTVTGSTSLAELPLMGGKYRQVRERLRRESDQEIKDEKLRDGRSIR